MVRARISNLLEKITVLIVICCLVMVGLCINTAAALPGSGTQEESIRFRRADASKFVYMIGECAQLRRKRIVFFHCI